METTPKLDNPLEGGSQHPLVRHLSDSEKDELLTILFNGARGVEDLLSSSKGVYGLHLNGDGADWSELVSGGRYEEWLNEWNQGIVMMDELCAKYLTNA